MLRQGTLEDIPVLVDMMEEFYAESQFELNRADASASFKTLLDEPNYGAIWIHDDEDQAAGYAVLTVRFSMEFGGLAGAIDDLYIRPQARRKGYGHKLLQSLLIDCHDRGLEALHVEVAPDNVPAQALYQQFGLQLRTDKRDHLTTLLKSAF